MNNLLNFCLFVFMIFAKAPQYAAVGLCEYPVSIKIPEAQRNEAQIDAIEAARRANVRKCSEKVALISANCPKTLNIVGTTQAQVHMPSALRGHIFYEIFQDDTPVGLMFASPIGAAESFDFFVYSGFERQYGQIVLGLVELFYGINGILNNLHVNKELYEDDADEFLVILFLYQDENLFEGWDLAKCYDSVVLNYMSNAFAYPNTIFKIDFVQWGSPEALLSRQTFAKRTIVKKKFAIMKELVSDENPE